MEVFSSEANCTTAIASNSTGTRLVVGSDDGSLALVDLEKQGPVVAMSPHQERVICLSVASDAVFASGSRDRSVMVHDVRLQNTAVFEIKKHSREVCVLKWDPLSHSLASGGNDNLVCVFDIRTCACLKVYQKHKAAVRALAWSPRKFGVLVSGGSVGDQSIKFWNVLCSEEQPISNIKSDSQVCEISFSAHSNEMATCHGYPSNQIVVWNLVKNKRVSIINGHQNRTLYAALGPDQESMLTCSADETLKFWKVFLRKKESDYAQSACFFGNRYFGCR